MAYRQNGKRVSECLRLGRVLPTIWQKPPPKPAIARPAVSCSGDFAVAETNMPRAARTSPKSLLIISYTPLPYARCGHRLQEQSASEEVRVGASNQEAKGTASRVCWNEPVGADTSHVAKENNEFPLHCCCRRDRPWNHQPWVSPHRTLSQLTRTIGRSMKIG